jgi:proteic killer suppression protein
VIRSFVHKGLQRFWETESTAGIQAKHAKRLTVILSHLHRSVAVQDMDLPGLRLHPLKGNKKGLWAVSVSGNWRLVFRFENGDAYVVDYLDYH